MEKTYRELRGDVEALDFSDKELLRILTTQVESVQTVDEINMFFMTRLLQLR